jgi:hypothetical protein
VEEDPVKMRFGREFVFETVKLLEIEALTSPVSAFIKIIV